MQQVGRLLRYPVAWFGGVRFLLLIVVVVGIAAGLYWERERHPPFPPGAADISSSINAGVRQTSFRFRGSVADIHAFYRQEMPKRGWRYCGTQTTARCSNMITLAGGADQQVDVYRQAGDVNYTGPTIEVWPIQRPGQETFATLFETSPR
jgi:hypothetical protein